MERKLKDILTRLDDLDSAINREGRAQRAELEERLRLGLTGDAAIKHYNDFMSNLGLDHLIVL